MTEVEAKSRGFSSVDQFEEVRAKGLNLIRDGKGWSAEDFAYYRQAMNGGADMPAVVAAFALGRLVRIDQCRQGLAILGSRPITSTARRGAWAEALRKWSSSPKMRPLLTEVMSGQNPDLSKIAKEVVNGQTAQK